MSSDKNYQGTDVNLEISLEEYGFVARPITVDYADEYFVIYKMDDNQYGSGHIRESELDAIVNGTEWASEEDVNSMLETVGATKEEWFDLPFTSKFSDLVSYWGTENIMGTDYYPNDKKWAFEEIGLESDSDDLDDLVEYVVPTHYATALINGDYSGLSDEEEQELNEFTETVIERTGNAHFMLGNNDEGEYFSYSNDVNNLGSDVMKVYIRPSDSFANGGESKIPTSRIQKKLIGKTILYNDSKEYVISDVKYAKNGATTLWDYSLYFEDEPNMVIILSQSEMYHLYKIGQVTLNYMAEGSELRIKSIYQKTNDKRNKFYRKIERETNIGFSDEEVEELITDVKSKSNKDGKDYTIYVKDGKLLFDESLSRNLRLDPNKKKIADISPNKRIFRYFADHRLGNGGGVGQKVYNEQFGIGKSKYVVNFYDGVKTHNDGSAFFDIRIFKNIPDKNKFINELKSKGYVMKYADGGGVKLPKDAKIRINWVDVSVYKDSWEEGETDNVNNYDMVGIKGSVVSPKELIGFLAKNIYTSEDISDYVLIDNNIHTSVRQDADGMEASKSEIEEWKKGNLELFSANYVINVSVISEIDADAETLSSITGIGVYKKGGKVGKYAKGGGVNNMSYENIYEVLKDKIEESTDDLGRTYENSSDFTGEEIEHKFRDGFIPYTNGGYELSWYEYVSTLNSTGYTLPTEKLQAEMQRHVDYSYELAKDNFKDTYPEIVEIVGEDNIDYNSLDEAGFTDEAQKLSDWEMEYLSDEDTIRCSIIAYYYEPTNEKGQDGKHTISLQGDINLEAPYHRKGKNDDFTEVIFTFDSMEELNSKMDDGLKQVIDWFNGSKPTGSDDSFAKGGKAKPKAPKIVRTQFEEGEYEYAKGGGVDDKMSFDEFSESLQEYEIEGGFGKTLEKGFRMYYLPKDNPYLNTKFNHRNKRKAYQQYLKMDLYSDGGGVEFIQYKENEIMYSSDLEEYYVDDEQFKTLEEAKAYIDNGSPISDWKKDAYRRGMFKTGGGVGIIAEYEDGVLISKPYYFETNDFFKSEGYRIDNKFAENYWASFPIFKGVMTKKQALSKANSFYDFVKKAKTEKDYEDLSQQFIEDWNKKFANGGGVGKERFNLHFNYNPSNLSNEDAEKIVEQYTKDWKHDNDWDNVSFYVFNLTKEKADELKSELKMEDTFNIEIEKSRNSFAKGGGVDDADWIEESLIDLQNEVDMDDLVVENSNNNHYTASNGNAEFEVFETEDDARERAIERVKEDLEENPEYFNRVWLTNYIDGKDFFERVFNEWNESYVNDIESEDSDEYANRLIEEMVENGIVSSEEAKEEDFDAEDYKDSFVELLTNNQIEEGYDGLQNYIDNFGEEQAFKVVVDNNLIDIDKASESAVDTDGIAHFLSSYDGEQIDLSNGHVAYRTN